MSLIIGLTGKFAAGKGTVADTLVHHGFRYHSLSDVIRDALSAQGIPESREALTEMGNALRRAEGPQALALGICRKIQADPHHDHIVDSIRNPAEVVTLRTLPGFRLLGIDADPRLRFDRLRARNRAGDPETFAYFQELEAKETHSADPTTQQLHATWALVDEILHNDGDLHDLNRAVAATLERLRPT